MKDIIIGSIFMFVMVFYIPIEAIAAWPLDERVEINYFDRVMISWASLFEGWKFYLGVK